MESENQQNGMAQSFEEFEKAIQEHEELYDELQIRVVCGKYEGEWWNVQTELHIQSSNLAGEFFRDLSDTYEGYRSKRCSLEDVSAAIHELIKSDSELFDIDIKYPGISVDEKKDTFWKKHAVNSVHSDAYQNLRETESIRVAPSDRNTEIPSDFQNVVEKDLRRSKLPFRNLDDLISHHTTVARPRWRNHPIDCYAPLYIWEEQSTISEGNKLSIKLKSHSSVEDVSASVWSIFEDERLDRDYHESFETECLSDELVNHTLVVNYDEPPQEVNYAIFPSEFDEIRGGYSPEFTETYRILAATLGKEPDDLNDILSNTFRNAETAQGRKAEFGSGFEADVLTAFNLAGLLTISPEWFKQHADRNSLPDGLAISDKESLAIIIECTTSSRRDKILEKMNDVVDAVDYIRSNLESDWTQPYTLVPIVTAPIPDTSASIDRDVNLLLKDELLELNRLCASGADTHDIVTKLGISGVQY